MNKEELNKLLTDVIKRLNESLNGMKEDLKKDLDKPCGIHIDKDKNGKVNIEVIGNRFNLLTTLAGAKKEILKDLRCSNTEWEFIENKVDTREVKTNE